MKPRLLLVIIGIFVALLIVLALQGCQKNDVSPTQFLSNGNAEIGSNLPNGWWYNTGLSHYTIEWSDKESFSPSRSLKISNTNIDLTNFAFWAQTIHANIPIGEDVTLKVKIKGELTGPGVSIVIRGDDTDSPQGTGEQFVTTQGTFPISGTFDWNEYSVKMSKVGSGIKSLTIYLVFLSNTTGDVYFDDVSVTN